MRFTSWDCVLHHGMARGNEKGVDRLLSSLCSLVSFLSIAFHLGPLATSSLYTWAFHSIRNDIRTFFAADPTLQLGLLFNNVPFSVFTNFGRVSSFFPLLSLSRY